MNLATRLLQGEVTISKLMPPHNSVGHVAGGALRDALLGLPIRDVDVFFPGSLPNICESRPVEYRLVEYHCHNTIELFSAPPGLSLVKRVMPLVRDTSYFYGEFESWHVEGEPEVNIILCSAPSIEKVVEGFHCNMSKIWATGVGEDYNINVTPDFQAGYNHRQVMLHHTTSPAYAKKMQEKFAALPDWSLVASPYIRVDWSPF